ncbi:MAG: hypothetical protein HYV27_05910 [Candidatus Hydrogenedentes bacterium]|nr:hypothetical protein [Candidatus Hydrogenedentota bacterium]
MPDVCAPITASALARMLSHPSPDLLATLAPIYGANPAITAARIRLLLEAAEAFHAAFGDQPVRLFRAPGRINLRGMHVDTHGGYLNLMTHQREVVLIAATTDDGRCHFLNTDPQHSPVTLDLFALDDRPDFAGTWARFIESEEARVLRASATTDWAPYVQGAAYRVRHGEKDRHLRGLRAVVASDLPEGSALSSSAALCSVIQLALARCNGLDYSCEAHIRLARDGEWFTGARTGLADQSAMWLGAADTLQQLAIRGDDIGTATMRTLTWPEDLSLLVVQSFTQRSLSGAQLLDYTSNRFAYSMAMAVMQIALQRISGDAPLPFHYLSDWPAIAPCLEGGVYELLREIPVEASLDSLRNDYSIPGIDEAYQRYFGQAPQELRPRSVPLRGPLLFGLAESERARAFLGRLAERNYDRAAALMNAGHDGDRVRMPDGTPCVHDVSDAALRAWSRASQPLALCPGAYGASSPILDALVDTARAAGAIGASLTGAGIAGSILVLCARDTVPAVRNALAVLLLSPRYEALTGHAPPEPDAVQADAILENCATSGAGEIDFARL